MEEFLKEGPSDFNTDEINLNHNVLNDNSNNNAYSLNPNNQPQMHDNTTGGDNVHFQDDYLSPTSNPNLYNNDMNNFTSSIKPDPFLEDLESINFSHNQQHQAPQHPSHPGQIQDSQSQFLSNLSSPNPLPVFNDPSQQTSNLDELISPGNDNSLSFNNGPNRNQDNSFLNPQYFSPPNNRSNYNPLNSIAEDSLSNSFSNNTFNSRHGSISVAPPSSSHYGDINQNTNLDGSYLSPPTNSQFMSPSQTSNYDTSFDTLVSPSYNSGSYLNSPPPNYQSIRVPTNNNNLSSSIPNNGMKHNMLSPPSTGGHFGTSAPSSTSINENQYPHQSHFTKSAVSTKQLSKEEKLKRRREFHNAVERRRRDLIKERIKELGLLVPPSLLNPQLSAVRTLQKSSELNSREINDLLSSIKVKETKPNKSTILNKSVDYINHLKYVLEEQDKARFALESQISQLENRLSTTSVGASNNDYADNVNNHANFGIKTEPDSYGFQDLQNQSALPHQPQQGQHQAQYQQFSPQTQPPGQYQNIQGEEYFNPDEFFSDLVATDDPSAVSK